jgi:hypothetical protein
MSNPIIRLAPSGPPILNSAGGPLGFGPGARLRLTEACSVMGGSQAIPTVPDVIAPDGFGATDAIVLTLDSPKEGLNYRANICLDVLNTSTNAEGEVVLYLDVSIDSGATYTNRAKNVHLIGPLEGSGAQARSAQVWLPLITGAALGVVDATPPASIKLRARAQAVAQGVPGSLLVSSLATSDGGSPVSGLNGTIHMELEECF